MDTNDSNILEVGQELANTAMSILTRWGTFSPSPGSKTHEVSEISGTIQMQSDVIRIGPSVHNWQWVTLKGYLKGPGKFKVISIQGNPHSAAEWLEKLALYLSSKDFKMKVKGSISRLKAITAALE